MTEPVAVLCFAAGGVRFAVAVADVLGLRDDDGATPAIAGMLGLRDGGDALRRVMTLASPRGPIDAAIDGPMVVRTVAVEQIVAAPAGVPLAPAVLGFAHVDGELVQLLEIERVVADLEPPRGTS
jgi:hypothetical protein